MTTRPTVTDKDRRHFRVIAEAEAELNLEATRACGRRDPGRNIEIGLELSEFAASFGSDLSRPDEVAPIQIWRARRRRE